MVALILWACGTRDPGFGGCAAVRDGVEREECRFAEAKKLISDPPAFAAAVDSLSDPTTRDLLLVRLAMDTPDRSAQLCTQVVTDVARQRCQQILGRPHLRGAPP